MTLQQFFENSLLILNKVYKVQPIQQIRDSVHKVTSQISEPLHSQKHLAIEETGAHGMNKACIIIIIINLFIYKYPDVPEYSFHYNLILLSCVTDLTCGKTAHI